MVTLTVTGNYKKTRKFLTKSQKMNFKSILEKYAQAGVEALSSATPKNTGSTSSGWGYEIAVSKHDAVIYWTNNNANDGVNIALILQLGHGTGTGGYVAGIDYINPAIRPVFNDISDAAWKEVNSI